MKKETMLDGLEKALEMELEEFDFAIDWDTKNHRVEVLVTLFAENKDQEAIQDSEGVETLEEVIEFEDAIIFYPVGKTQPNKEDYLATLAFDKKKGLSKEYLTKFAQYLNEVLIQGQDDLLDFLSDESIETFGLSWDEDVFASHLDGMVERTFLPYPKY